MDPLTLGRLLIGGASLLTTLSIVVFGPRYDLEPDWPTHAEVTVVQGQAWLVGITSLAVILAWVPLGNGMLWAWWALVVAGAVQFGGYFGPLLLFGRGRTSALALAWIALLALAYAAGLVLAR